MQLLCLICLCYLTLQVSCKNPRVFVGGLFDYRSKGQYTNFYGVAIWDDEYDYWIDLGGGLVDRTLYFNDTSKPYYSDDILCSYWDDQSQSLLIGGRFTKIGDVETVNIVSYDLDSKTWKALTKSCDGDVLTISGTSKGIVIGGNFQKVDGVTTGPLALLNSDTNTWSSLGLVGSSVRSTILYNNDTLFVGGQLTSANDTLLQGIAAYQVSTGQWYSPGVVCGGEIIDFAQIKNFLYIGGNFSSYGNGSCPGAITGTNIAEYDLKNSVFTEAFSEVLLFKGGNLLFLAPQGSDKLLVGGEFSSIDSKVFDRFAYYTPSTGTWSSISTGGIPFTGEAYTAANYGSAFYFGGYFTSNFWGVARFDRIWSNMDSGLGCSFCSEIDDGTFILGKRKIPMVNTITLLPAGAAPPQTPTDSSTVPQYQLLGSKGKWEEYGIDPFPGSSVLWGNSTNYVESKLTNTRTLSFYWQTWSVIGSAIFIGSLFLASVLHMCVKSLY